MVHFCSIPIPPNKRPFSFERKYARTQARLTRSSLFSTCLLFDSFLPSFSSFSPLQRHCPLSPTCVLVLSLFLPSLLCLPVFLSRPGQIRPTPPIYRPSLCLLSTARCNCCPRSLSRIKVARCSFDQKSCHAPQVCPCAHSSPTQPWPSIFWTSRSGFFCGLAVLV